ncbi:MAG: cation transporter [Acidobacteria bacterium]|nr:MAG: cation transporter [Acidobacteriota bacterium]
MKRSVIFDVALRGLAPILSLLALFLLVSAHNAPGGGFVSGLVVAGLFSLFYVAQGRAGLMRIQFVRPVLLVGVGFGVAVISGIVPVFFGGDLLGQEIFTVAIPFFGQVKFPTSLVFDTGILLVVAGSVNEALLALTSRGP